MAGGRWEPGALVVNSLWTSSKAGGGGRAGLPPDRSAEPLPFRRADADGESFFNVHLRWRLSDVQHSTPAAVHCGKPRQGWSPVLQIESCQIYSAENALSNRLSGEKKNLVFNPFTSGSSEHHEFAWCLNLSYFFALKNINVPYCSVQRKEKITYSIFSLWTVSKLRWNVIHNPVYTNQQTDFCREEVYRDIVRLVLRSRVDHRKETIINNYFCTDTLQ